jgi:hypothetical protein
VGSTADYKKDDVTISINTDKAKGAITQALIEAIRYLFHKLGLEVSINYPMPFYYEDWKPYQPSPPAQPPKALEWNNTDYNFWNTYNGTTTAKGTALFGEDK